MQSLSLARSRPISARLEAFKQPADSKLLSRENRKKGPQGCICPFCSPNLYWNNFGHKKILSSCDRKHGLEYGSHEAMDLAKLAMEWIQNAVDQPSERQREAIQAWHTPYLWTFGPVPGRAVSDEDLRTLCNALDIFNDLFLFGAVPTQDIQVLWFSEGSPKSCDYDGWTPWDAKALTGTIELKSTDEGRNLLSTILHEMIHALLQAYSCTGDCKARKHCQRLRGHSIGDDEHGTADEHGIAFNWISKAIEEAAYRLLGFTADLGLPKSM